MKDIENDRRVRCGEWELVQEIGHGAYGVVYRAIGPEGARAAVKVCRRDVVGDERCGRELRGVRLYKSIPPQEGLVRVRELVETDWGFYTVMDLADDEFDVALNSQADYRPKTLARVIVGEKALSLKACVKLALSLAKGLVALQQHHLLHRDIKPGNVIYVGGKPVLSDPSLLVEESEAVSFVGTPGYVPPERFTEAASDVYSLGLTLKAASFGRQIEELDKGPALEADTGAAFFPVWWRILNKATEAMPSRRYQSARALLKDLKTLRLKVAVSSMLGSRVGRGILFAASVMVAVFVVPEFCSLMRFKGDMASMIAQSERETLWPFYTDDASLSSWIPLKSNEDCVADIRNDIVGIAATNQACTKAFQAQLNKVLEIDKKASELLRQISALRMKSEEKHGKGRDDGDEFRQAKRLHKERMGLIEECRSILKQLPSAYDL